MATYLRYLTVCFLAFTLHPSLHAEQQKPQDAYSHDSTEQNNFLRAQSLLTTLQAKNAMEKGDLVTSLLLIREALPGAEAYPERPPVFEARSQFYATFAHLQGVMVHEGWVSHATFSPDGQYIATSSNGHTLRLWRHNGRFIKNILARRGAAQNITFSPDSKTIAIASFGKNTGIWPLNGEPPKLLKGHKGGVKHITFSPVVYWVATAYMDDTAHLCKNDGTLIKTLEGHEDDVQHAIFSPD
ncbi:MAG: hypothetical protein AAF512_19175, partial [Pseudomonadota bacterium]